MNDSHRDKLSPLFSKCDNQIEFHLIFHIIIQPDIVFMLVVFYLKEVGVSDLSVLSASVSVNTGAVVAV